MAKQDPKQKFLQELEDTLLANPSWYGDTSRKMHSISQKVTVLILKSDKQKVEEKQGHPIPVQAPEPAKKPTLLQLYKQKAAKS